MKKIIAFLAESAILYLRKKIVFLFMVEVEY